MLQVSITMIICFKYGMPMIARPQDRRFERPSPVRGDVNDLVELGQMAA